jgi:serine/threonine-protein kinase
VVYVRSNQPENTVVRQSPAAGTSVRRGSVVRIDVSAGPTPAYQTVPNVVGQTERAARRTLRQAGFTVAVFRVAGRSGIVVRQQPASGNNAPQGGQVDIFVGTG